MKALQAKQKNESELEKAHEKLNLLRREQEEMEQDALVVISAVEAAKALMAEKEEELKEISKKFETLKSVVSKIKCVEIDLREEMKKITDEITANKNDMKEWHLKILQLQKQHMDDQIEFNLAVQSAISSSSASNENENIESLPTLAIEQLEYANRDCDELKREINLLETEKDK